MSDEIMIACSNCGPVSPGGHLLACKMLTERTADLAATKARAERAESDLALILASNDRYGAQLDSMTATVKALNVRLAEQNRIHVEAIRGCRDGAVILAAERRQAEEQAELERVRADRAEARLAEVAPVMEAAVKLEPHVRTTSAYMDGTTACCVEQKGVKILGELRGAVRAMLGARAGREGAK